MWKRWVLLVWLVLLAMKPRRCLSVSDQLSAEVDADLLARNISLCDEEHLCRLHEKGPRPLDGWEMRGCTCDLECAEYEDCCRDAPSEGLPRADVTCRKLRHFAGIYMVQKCPADYERQDVRRLCETETATDPFLRMPVSSPSSRLTYSNFYCAVCHNRSSDAVLWTSRVECPTLPRITDHRTVQQKLRQNAAGLWGVDMQQRFHICRIDPFFPETVQYFVRQCRQSVASCPDGWQDRQVARLCSLYSGYVYDDNDQVFRNPHCALCHGVDPQHCLERPLGRGGGQGWLNTFNPRAFTVLLDFNLRSGDQVGQLDAGCSDTQLWDPFFKRCRDVVCDAEGYELVDDRCQRVQQPLIPDIQDNSTAATTPRNNSTPPSDRDIQPQLTNSSAPLDDDFVLCPKYQLNSSEYVLGANETVFIPLYGRTLQPGQYQLQDSQQLVICAVTESISKFVAVIGYICMAGIFVSTVCLCVHLVAFFLVPDLRNLSGMNLTSMCLCLLIAHFSMMPDPEKGSSGCFIQAIVAYAAWMSSLVWMNVIAFDIFITLRQATRELRVASGRRMKRFLIYCLYVFAVTGCMMTLSLLAENGSITDLRPQFGTNYCWFNGRKALLLLFACPMIVLMSANLVFFVASVMMIRSTTNSTARMSCAQSRVDLRLYSRLAVIMGLAWVVSLLANWLDFRPLTYISLLLLSLQGFFIFVSFTMTDKIREKLRRRCCCISSYCKIAVGRRAAGASISGTAAADSSLQTYASNLTSSNSYTPKG